MWCVVEDFLGELLLRVYDPTTGQALASEVRSSVAAVVERADDLRRQFTADGWLLLDIDLDEPD